MFGKKSEVIGVEKEELIQLRKEKMEKMEKDINVLRKCINVCSQAIDTNQKTISNLITKLEEMEGKEEENAVREAMDEMFG